MTMMLRVVALWILSFVSTVHAMAGGATTLPTTPGEPFKHEPSGMVFPPSVGSFVRQQAHRFDAAGLDVSVGYNDPGVRAVVTVYVYPLASRPSFDDDVKGVNAEVIRAHESARLISSADRKITQGTRDLVAKESIFEMPYRGGGDGVELRSRAILLVNGENIVKFRITYLKAGSGDVEKRIDMLLASLKLPQ